MTRCRKWTSRRIVSRASTVLAAAGLVILGTTAGSGAHAASPTHALSARWGTQVAQVTQVARHATAGPQAASGAEPDFKVQVHESKIYGHPKQRLVTGTWDFPNKWAGQEHPVDIAALQIRAPSCYHLVDPASATYSVDNTVTNLGSLRDLNVHNESPIWNIADYTKGFADQADSGYVSITLSRHCKKVHHNLAASFHYEAIEGGSIVSVSVGWGVFDVSLDSPHFDWQKGTPAIYFKL